MKAHCKDSTYAGYEDVFRLYLKPRFGEKDINEITRGDVKQLPMNSSLSLNRTAARRRNRRRKPAAPRQRTSP